MPKERPNGPLQKNCKTEERSLVASLCRDDNERIEETMAGEVGATDRTERASHGGAGYGLRRL
jgi:hypothetical protein